MQMKSFAQYLAEDAAKEMVFTFGRFNPPTIGHEKLLDKVAAIAKGKSYRVYASHSVDSKKNPLPYAEKIKWMRKMFPKHARSIVDDDANNVFEICSTLYKQGFTKVTMVVGGERVAEFDALLNKYNGQKLQNGFFNFEGGITVVSAGDRDPDSDGVTGMSASKMRAAASANDLELFSKGIPSSFSKGIEGLFNAVRTGMGLKESRNFRKHIQLESVGQTREAYVNGDLFQVGDTVVVKESEEIAKISRCGPNYLIVEFADGTKHRKWLNAVDLLKEDEVPFGAVSPDVWMNFCPSTQSLGIPRCDMPQIQNEDREGLIKFLASRGISSSTEQINPGMLKPTQSEYSPDKVAKATEHEGQDRPLIVSADGHILDGHHQWMAQKAKKTESVQILRFKSSIKELVSLALSFPKSFRDFGAAEQPQQTESTLTVSQLRKLRAIKNPTTTY
jgi:hypothetical protein